MTTENSSRNNALSEDENSVFEVGVERRNSRHKDWSLPRRGKSKIATVKPVSKYMTSSEEDLSTVSDGECKPRRASIDRASPRISRLLSKDVTEMGKDALILELENCLNELEAEQMCNDSLEDDYVKVEEERNELVEELETAFAELREYTGRVKKVETEKNAIAEERDELAKECEHLKYVLTHRDEIESQKYGWRKEKDRLEKLVDELESRNKELTFEIDNLYEERQGLISSLLNLNSVEVNEVIKTRSRTSSVVSTDSVSSLARLKSESDELSKFFTESEDGSEQGSTAHQIVEYKRKIHELEGAQEDLANRCETLESTKSMMEDERDIMHSRIKQLEEEVERKEAKERELDNKSKLVDKLQEEVNRLTAAIKNIQSSITASRQKHTELKARNDSLEGEKRRLEKEVETAKKNSSKAEQRLHEESQASSKNLQDLVAEKEGMQREIMCLKEECDGGQRKIKHLESSLKETERASGDLSKAKEQNRGLVSEVADLKEKDTERDRVLKSLENEKEELVYQLQKAKEEKNLVVGNLDKANKRISAICDDLERAHKEKQKLREAVEALQNSQDDLCRREKLLERELQSVKTENEVLRENDRSVTEKRIKELEIDFEDRIQELYKEREALSSQIKRLSSTSQENTEVRQQLETENASLKTRLRHLEKEKGSYALLLKEKSSLEKYVDNLKAESERSMKKYEEEAKALKERLSHFEEAHVSSSQLKKEKEILEKAIEALKADNNKLREQLKRQRLSSNSAQELVVNRLKTENEALDHRAEVLQDALSKANIENRSLLERMHRAEESTASTIRSLKARKSELQMQCSKLQHERDDFERENNQLRQRINSIENKEDGYEDRKSQSEAAVSELELQLRSREEELRSAHSKIAELELDNREHTRKLQASEILVLDLQSALARANDLAMEKALEVSRGKRTYEKKIGQISKDYTDLKRKLFVDGHNSSGLSNSQHVRALSETDSGLASSSPDIHTDHTKVQASWSESAMGHLSDHINHDAKDNPLPQKRSPVLSDRLLMPSDSNRQRSSSQINKDHDEQEAAEVAFSRQNSLPLSQKDNDSKFTFGVIASSNLMQSFSTGALPTTGGRFEKADNSDDPPKKPPPPLFYDARAPSSPKLHRRIQLKQIPFPSLSPTSKVNGNEGQPRMEHWV